MKTPDKTGRWRFFPFYCLLISVCSLAFSAFAEPLNGDFGNWNGEQPANWKYLKRPDRKNTFEKTKQGIHLNGMVVSDRFKMPSKKVKVTLSAGPVHGFVKVYLFQYTNKNDVYFMQCGQAFDLPATDKAGTYTAVLDVSMQGQRYAAVAIDAGDALIRSVAVEPVKTIQTKTKLCEIPVTVCLKAPRLDGTWHEEDWKNCFVFQNPFRSIGQKINHLNGEKIYLQSDGKNLYVMLRTRLAENARHTKRDSQVYLDSSLELVFSPENQQQRIFHIIVNFAGTVYDEEAAVGQTFLNWNCKDIKTAVCRNNDETMLQIAIPFASVQIKPEDGWRFNICRNMPQSSEYAAMNTGGYLKNLMKGFLCRDLKHCMISVSAKGNILKLEAEGAGTFAAAEYGGLNFRADRVLSSGAAEIIANRENLPEGLFELTLETQGKCYFRSDVQFGKALSPVKPAAKQKTQLIYYPVQKKIAVILNDLTLTQRDSIEKVVCSLNGKKITVSGFRPFSGLCFAAADYAVPADGTVEWTASVIQKNGKELEKAAGKFDARKEFVWVGNQIGKEPVILPGFSPMTVSGNQISCVCRDTKFGNNGFPESIVADGKEVLAAPVKLYVRDASGKEIPFAGEGFKVTSAKPERVEFSARSSGCGIAADLSAWMEYDGLIYYTMTLLAEKAMDVTRLYLEIPYADASLFHIAGPSFRSPDLIFKRTVDLKGNGVVWKSTDSPCGGVVYGSFLPHVWLGNFRNGLSFFAEHDRNWINSRKSPCYELIRRDGKLYLRVNFVAIRAKLSGSRTVQFGLLANPWKKKTMTGVDQELQWGTSFARTFFNKGLIAIDPFITNLMLDAKTRKSYLAYTCGNEYVEGDPEFKSAVNEMNRTLNQVQFNNWESSRTRCTGGMNAEDYMSRCILWNQVRVDFMIWRLNELLKKTVVDGVYLDNSYCTFSDNPMLQDQGFLREDGRWQGTYHLLSQREYLKRAAVLSQKYGKRFPHIVVHNTGCMLPNMTFADAYMDGELDIADYYGTFSLAWNEVMLAVNWGPVPGRLTMLTLAAKKQNRALFSVFKLYDMSFWVTHSGFDRKLYRQTRAIERSFGTNAPDSRFFGYWDPENPVKPVTPTAIGASCFRRANGKMLIYLGNPTGKDDSVSFDLKGFKVKDAFTGKKITFPAAVKSHDFMALIAEPEQ